jgi:Domain of unknown function (DUF5916)
MHTPTHTVLAACLLPLVFVCFNAAPLQAQRAPVDNEASYTIKIKRASGKITLDGRLDDAAWAGAEPVSNFILAQPVEGAPAQHQTEVRLLFDDQFIYLGAKCYEDRDKYVVQSLRRDFPGGTTDILGINLDPFRDRQNAFHFTVSALGVQREGLVSNGNLLSTDWDNRWYSKVENYPDHWIVEYAIPFKSIRYRQEAGENRWLVNFLRFDQSMGQAERSSWAPIPRQFNGNDVNFSGTLLWESPPPAPGANIAVIPYVLGQGAVDYLNNKPLATNANAGLDAKIAISSSLNLDLTFNPDFAQVEVDRQVTNLSRFELFFPERRQFFLENADLFGAFGFGDLNPLFSRRIGLARDRDDNLVNVPILAGARLSGRLNQNWRIGAMSMQTGFKRELGVAATNFSTVAVQRRLFSRSNLAFIFVNKQNFALDSAGRTNWRLDKESFNRVAGLDFNYFSPDGRWRTKSFVHRSFSPEKLDGKAPYVAATSLEYRAHNLNVFAQSSIVGEHYSAETGFVPRRDFLQVEPFATYTFWRERKRVLSWFLGVDSDVIWRKSDRRLTDWDFSPVFWGVNFQNSAQIRITPIRWNYTYLFEPFDPTNTDGKQLPEGTSYLYRNIRIFYHSDLRRRFNYTLQGRFGEYFNGNLNSIQANIGYRVQPYGILSVDATYNRINLPEGFNDRTLWLVGPRFDLTFVPNLFLTTFLQYNNQVNNVNLNMRLQWRFAPVSDLFIVYTDNYFANADEPGGYRAFESKNRALVLKCTYWLNI